MSEGVTGDIWFLSGLAVLALAGVFAFCRICLMRRVERIRGLWDDIYFCLRKRCELVGDLSDQLRVRLKTNPKLADDIRYLLRRMEETNDPHTHAAVQNGLVLTVQTAVEQFHRMEKFRADSELSSTMHKIGGVDSQLLPMRDRFNESVRRYNSLLNVPPFSAIAYLTRTEERPLFAMLIPWWSTDPAAYGSISTDEIRHRLQKDHAPLILAPSQRAEWSGDSRVVRVADRLLRRQDSVPNEKTTE